MVLHRGRGWSSAAGLRRARYNIISPSRATSVKNAIAESMTSVMAALAATQCARTIAGAVLGHRLALGQRRGHVLDGAGDGDLSVKDRSRAQAFPGPDAGWVGGAGREAGHGPVTFGYAIVRP